LRFGLQGPRQIVNSGRPSGDPGQITSEVQTFVALRPLRMAMSMASRAREAACGLLACHTICVCESCGNARSLNLPPCTSRRCDARMSAHDAPKQRWASGSGSGHPNSRESSVRCGYRRWAQEARRCVHASGGRQVTGPFCRARPSAEPGDTGRKGGWTPGSRNERSAHDRTLSSGRSYSAESRQWEARCAM
jgi:hypothetical protein